MIICGLSGIPPKNPVISLDGYVFDQCAILEHLSKSESCPLSGRPLTESSLISVNSPPSFVISRVLSTRGSIPSLISFFRQQVRLFSSLIIIG